MSLIGKLRRRFFPVPPQTEALMYRVELYAELLERAGKDAFRGARILEIGPKDGLDSRRLAALEPSELVLIDLPSKQEKVHGWFDQIACKKNLVLANFLYLTPEEYRALGKFRLIWCTGVLYHNAEQLRFLRKLYTLLEPGGCLVLETATFRGPKSLRTRPYVQVYYPEAYNELGTVTHLPTPAAVDAWLGMAGFAKIHPSGCYRKYNRDLIGLRYACICVRGAEDAGRAYYNTTGGANSKYIFGESQ